MEDFIRVYDDRLSKEECQLLIDEYESLDPCMKIFDSRNSGNKKGETFFCHLNDKLYDRYNIPLKKSLWPALDWYKDELSSGLEIGAQWSVRESYNFQKFKEGGGYYTLHCEQDGISPERMLVWMLYLNDAQCGTEFPYQNKIIEPKVGRLVIWPAAWTHSHKGVTPNKGDKYMMTGWCSYIRRDETDPDHDYQTYQDVPFLTEEDSK